MINIRSAYSIGIIIITLAIAMILMIVPIPDQVKLFRPEFVLMVLIYWAISLPHKVSIGSAWIAGVLMDSLIVGPLGIMAFSYTLVIFFTSHFHLRIRQYPVWQQALTISTLVLAVHIIATAVSPQAINWHISLPAVSSMLIWPINYALLRNIRRFFNVG